MLFNSGISEPAVDFFWQFLSACFLALNRVKFVYNKSLNFIWTYASWVVGITIIIFNRIDSLNTWYYSFNTQNFLLNSNVTNNEQRYLPKYNRISLKKNVLHTSNIFKEATLTPIKIAVISALTPNMPIVFPYFLYCLANHSNDRLSIKCRIDYLIANIGDNVLGIHYR